MSRMASAGSVYLMNGLVHFRADQPPGQPWVNTYFHDDVIKWNIFRVTDHLCGNSPVIGEFPAQRPVTRSFDVSFDLRLNQRLSKQ